MTIIFDGPRSVHVATSAQLVADDRELAWAERHVRRDRDLQWILGNFVEADNPNDNGHIFPLEQLKTAQASIWNKPLNLLHSYTKVVGAFVAAEMIFPVEETAAAGSFPFVEALAAMWKYYFPEAAMLVQKAHDEGALFFSMEAVPEKLECMAAGCGQVFAYEGRASETYCAHLMVPSAQKTLHQPHFTAGALILPPVRPGWRNADVKEISKLLNEHVDEAAGLYDQISTEFGHLSPAAWEQMMAALLVEAYEAREFPADKRKDLAKKGQAMSDGSFPIATVEDLKNAVRAIGRAKDPAAAKVHIKRRAKALGASDLIPEGW